MLQAMQRMGHIPAHAEQREGRAALVVKTLTPSGRKIDSCLHGGRAAPAHNCVLGPSGPGDVPREPTELA
jgi:hypothetical protein